MKEKESDILIYIQQNKINVIFSGLRYYFFINNSIKVDIDNECREDIGNLIRNKKLTYKKDIYIENETYKLYEA